MEPKKMIFNSGYIKSVLDGTERDLDKEYEEKSMPLPETYDYSKLVAPLKIVKNQGSTSMCVCYSLAYVLETLEYLSNPDIKFELNKDRVYDIRSNKPSDGMQIKEALEFVKHTGYYVGKDLHKILDYGKFTNALAVKKSLVLNGPCMFALPVYDDGLSVEFWEGRQFSGGHAVCCVGYNEEGFIIENSWGSSWGYRGKTTLPFNEVGKLYEAWGIIR